MDPGWLVPGVDYEAFLLTMSDGRILDKAVLTKLLREAALRMGLNPDDMDTHSLRAGSYTHLTLPTIYPVYIPAVPASSKKKTPTPPHTLSHTV